MRARLLLLAAALLAFGASLGSGFHFDDYAIFADSRLASPRGWLEIWNWRQTRPLTYLTFWLNHSLGGRDPVGYHAVNLALHVCAVLLVYECLRKLLPARAALFAAALFAVHPLQAESVDYVWGRSILLATVFCLASLLAWIDGKQFTAVAWFAAGLLAKEECAAWPLVLAAFEWGGVLPCPNGRTRKAWPWLAAMLGLASVAGVRVIYAGAVTPGSAVAAQAGVSPWQYFLAQGTVVWRYLRLLMVPYGFTVDPEVPVPAPWLGLLAWCALAAVVFLVWRAAAAGKARSAALWCSAGLILLIPSSTIFPAADLAADRRMYLPLLGFAAAAGLLLVRARPAVAVTVVLVLTAVSVDRTRVWDSDDSLWREAVRRSPGKVRPKIQLARNVPPAQALPLLADARKVAPDDPAIATETGRILMAQGQTAAALAEFGRALALDPRDARNYNNRGVALAALGQNAAARQDFLRALALDPGLTEAKRNLEMLPAP
jgi:hypothetical protein